MQKTIHETVDELETLIGKTQYGELDKEKLEIHSRLEKIMKKLQ